MNTLVLAYVGASLPLLLSYSMQRVDLLVALNFEAVAVQIVATLCGSIGLIAAVPLTTAIAAWLARGMAEDELSHAAATGAHAHSH